MTIQQIKRGGKAYILRTAFTARFAVSNDTINMLIAMGMPHIVNHGHVYISQEDYLDFTAARIESEKNGLWMAHTVAIGDKIYHSAKWYAVKYHVPYVELEDLPSVKWGNWAQLISEEDFFDIYWWKIPTSTTTGTSNEHTIDFKKEQQ